MDAIYTALIWLAIGAFVFALAGVALGLTLVVSRSLIIRLGKRRRARLLRKLANNPPPPTFRWKLSRLYLAFGAVLSLLRQKNANGEQAFIKGFVAVFFF